MFYQWKKKEILGNCVYKSNIEYCESIDEKVVKTNKHAYVCMCHVVSTKQMIQATNMWIQPENWCLFKKGCSTDGNSSQRRNASLEEFTNWDERWCNHCKKEPLAMMGTSHQHLRVSQNGCQQNTLLIWKRFQHASTIQVADLPPSNSWGPLHSKRPRNVQLKASVRWVCE